MCRWKGYDGGGFISSFSIDHVEGQADQSIWLEGLQCGPQDSSVTDCVPYRSDIGMMYTPIIGIVLALRVIHLDLKVCECVSSTH